MYEYFLSCLMIFAVYELIFITCHQFFQINTSLLRALKYNKYLLPQLLLCCKYKVLLPYETSTDVSMIHIGLLWSTIFKHFNQLGTVIIPQLCDETEVLVTALPMCLYMCCRVSVKLCIIRCTLLSTVIFYCATQPGGKNMRRWRLDWGGSGPELVIISDICGVVPVFSGHINWTLALF